MNMRLVFLGFLSVILAFYLKTQADVFDLSDDAEQPQRLLHYVFSILMGLLGLCLFYLAWKPQVDETAFCKIYVENILHFISCPIFELSCC